MARVFSWEQIEGNLIPCQADFGRVRPLTREYLDPLVARGIVLGALFYGSLAMGRPNRRSDVDLICLYENPKVVPLVKGKIGKVSRETRIEIEPMLLTKESAQRGLHTVHRTMRNHLDSIDAEENVIGRDPRPFLGERRLAITEELTGYLVHKVRRLKETGVDRYRTIQRALEAPVNVGRQVLEVVGKISDRELIGPGDGRAAVVTGFRLQFSDWPSLLDVFENLLEQDVRYDQTLERALTGKLSPEEYGTEIRRLELDVVPVAATWTEELSWW